MICKVPVRDTQETLGTTQYHFNIQQMGVECLPCAHMEQSRGGGWRGLTMGEERHI